MGKLLLEIDHIVRKNEYDLPTQIVWESPNLKQTISYIYDINHNLLEEYVIQVDKITNVIKSMYCKYYIDYRSIVFIDGDEFELIEVGI